MAVKVVVTVALTACFCLVEHLPAASRALDAAKLSTWQMHFVGQFLHANLFHLLANVCVLWQLRFSWRQLAVAYVFSVPATFVTSAEGVVGFSSVIYALMGLLLPRVRLSVRDWVLFLAANAATAFVPSIAFGVHVAAFGLGFLYAKIKMLADDYRRAYQRK